MTSLFSKKQTFVTLSIAEVEYNTTSAMGQDVVWLQKFFGRLFFQVKAHLDQISLPLRHGAERSSESLVHIH